jgi:hypothetical protein
MIVCLIFIIQCIFYFNFSYQVFWLFFGMALLLPLVLFSKKEKSQGKKKAHPAAMMIPAFCDVIATIFDSTGLIYVSN